MSKISPFMSKKPNKNLSRLEVERLKKKLKQRQVAEDLGIVKQQLNAIEKGKRTVSPELAFKIANYYSKPVEDFFLPTRFETRSLKNE
ncbi:helix-turn-helix transcriptional regulator [Bacillus pseudomycoides]|uniref:helix-turn-helix transcriptional regulator n=1 Tax=Bacillus pseudomycoides TaxID=64104 RepID=UPI00211D574C|nr:helix-turn-helix transcriptional regulator [Bacillus pseudomycoides]